MVFALDACTIVMPIMIASSFILKLILGVIVEMVECRSLAN
jgi:hypothetical protein